MHLTLKLSLPLTSKTSLPWLSLFPSDHSCGHFFLCWPSSSLFLAWHAPPWTSLPFGQSCLSIYLQTSLLLWSPHLISICFPDSRSQISHRSFCLKLGSLSYQFSPPSLFLSKPPFTKSTKLETPSLEFTLSAHVVCWPPNLSLLLSLKCPLNVSLSH